MIRSELIAAGRKVLKRFTDEGRGATLGDVARALDLASKLGRLASGMATDHTELTGQDGGPIQIELSAALNKIYGPVECGSLLSVESKARSHPVPLPQERGKPALPSGPVIDVEGA